MTHSPACNCPECLGSDPIHSLWEDLAKEYVLCPQSGFIQIERGQVCVIPKEVLTHRVTETYCQGDWFPIPPDKNHYCYLHTTDKYPIPRAELGWEYITFIVQNTEIISLGKISDIQIQENGSITYHQEHEKIVEVTIYGMIRTHTNEIQER